MMKSPFSSKDLIEALFNAARQENRGITFIGVRGQEEFLSYATLLKESMNVLGYLQKENLVAGDEVIFQISGEKDFVIAFWACILGGFVPVPLTVAKTNSQVSKFFKVFQSLHSPYVLGNQEALNDLLSDSTADTQLVSQIRKRTIPLNQTHHFSQEGSIRKAELDEIAFIQFSSGSTASPKGVALTHRNLIANMDGISLAGGYNSKDKMLSWMPLTHDMGMIGFHLNPIYCGIDQFIISTNLFVKDPAIWLDSASKHQITITSSPNFGYKYLLHRVDLNLKDWDLSQVRIIYNGAEPISLIACNDFLARLSGFGLRTVAMVPVYGLAEASVAVSMSEVSAPVQAIKVSRSNLGFGDKIKVIPHDEEGATFVNVGKAIPHCKLIIGDELGNPLDEGVIGQIQIKGTNVCTQYYNNRQAYLDITKKDNWLDTGDLGFVLDGNLYVTGRSKDVLFINGQNFYAHDIETEIESQENIGLNGCVVAGYFDAKIQTEKILAFVQYKGKLDLFASLKESVFQIAKRAFGFDFSEIIPVKSIPKTTSGKLQRFELLKRYHDGEYNETLRKISEQAVVPLQDQNHATSNLKRVTSIWKRVLKINNINQEDGFLHIGGNSMEAVEICNLIGSEWDVELTVENFYELKSIKNIADSLDHFPSTKGRQIVKAQKKEQYPLSRIQLGLYYRWKSYPQSLAYNVPVVLTLPQKPNLEKIHHILSVLIERHDALRMYVTEKEIPTCSFNATLQVELISVSCQDDQFGETVQSLVKPFDLHMGPLFRVNILENSTYKKFHCFFDFHHIIADGISIQTLLQEFWQLYQEQTLPVRKTDYVDFIEWEQTQANQFSDKHEAFWRNEFTEIPELQLPYDFSRPVVNDFAGQRLYFTLNSNLNNTISSFCKKEGISVHNFLCTCYYILLSKYSLQNEIVIGLPLHGRNHPGWTEVFGMFVNSLPVKISAAGETTLEKLRSEVSSKITLTTSHGEIPYFDILKLIDYPNRTDRNPLFDTMFVYRPRVGEKEWDYQEFNARMLDVNCSKFDISLEIREKKDELTCILEYATDLFEEQTIKRFASSYQRIVMAMFESPEMSLSNLSMISEQEAIEIKILTNGKKRVSPSFSPIHNLFFDQVARNPKAIALEEEGREVTYEKLAEEVKRFSNFLLDHEMRAEEIVAILVPKSIDFMIALLATMNAGCAFLPIDHELPLQRKADLIESSKCRYIISSSDLVKGIDLSALNCTLLSLDGTNHSATRSTTSPVSPNDLCYLIYTSGSTGAPKGVMITHENLFNYIVFAHEEYIKDDILAIPLYSSVSFDLTITSIFVPLISGGRIVIYEKKNPQEILIERVFRENRTDLVKMTPSHLKLLLNNNLISSSTRIRKYIVGGEALPAETVHQLTKSLSPEIELFNEYGPTEATVGCITYQFNDDVLTQIPIGRPISNMRCYVLDNQLNQVPYNVVGELYLAGSSLAKGYLNQKELTNDRFINDPFTKGEKMYKTGDLAKLSPNGYIQYIGRNDRQIKLNGYRIELGEVEAKIRALNEISEVVVLEIRKPYSKLVAYCLMISERTRLNNEELRNKLSIILPHYMMPDDFIQVSTIPITSNGKVDSEKLIRSNIQYEPVKIDRVQSDIETVLLKVWRSFFGNPQIDVHSNIYDLGIDSIKAVQLSARLIDSGIKARSKDILSQGSINHLSKYCEKIDGHQNTTLELPKGNFKPTPIISWFLNSKHSNPDFYNQSVLLELKMAKANIASLTSCFGYLVRKHSTLCLNLDTLSNTLFYNNDHIGNMPFVENFEVKDLNELKAKCETLKSGFHLSSSLLIKASTLLCQGKIYFFITAHHLVIDGVSWRILLEDIYQYLNRTSDAAAVNTGNSSITFKKWSDQFQIASGPAIQYADLKSMPRPSTYLPHDLEPDTWLIGNQHSSHLELNESTTTQLLIQLRRIYHSELHVLLNAAMVRILHSFTGQNDILIEQESHGRKDDQVNNAGTVGWFTSMFPVVFRYKKDIGALIQSVKSSLQQDFSYSTAEVHYYQQIHQDKRTGIRLNYLGEFGEEFDNELFTFKNEIDTGKEQDDSNFITAELEINAMIVSRKLHLQILYNSKAHSISTVNQVKNGIVQFLIESLEHMNEETISHFTPADFHADLNEEELNTLLG